MAALRVAIRTSRGFDPLALATGIHLAHA